MPKDNHILCKIPLFVHCLLHFVPGAWDLPSFDDRNKPNQIVNSQTSYSCSSTRMCCTPAPIVSFGTKQ